MMKRKKWSELEEQTLLTKYSDLLNSGTLAKLKTREKKFKPIADHVNSIHHLRDPFNFPFKWTWRDVFIKVQNMRHQYLGVKQKIRISNDEFNWDDGENHWENFLKYKEVFGDVELEVKGNGNKRSNPMQEAPSAGMEFGDDGGAAKFFEEEGVMGLNFGIGSEEMEEEEEEEEDGEFGENVMGVGIKDGELGGERGEKEEIEDSGFGRGRKWKKDFDGKRFRMVGAQVVELRDVVLRREKKRREREWSREEGLVEREQWKKERELVRERRNLKREDDMDMRELELEEWQMMWARRELERRVRLEREIGEERRRRMKLERWEEEKMEWREKMVGMQLEHEKQMIQMHADACQNQLQIFGVITRLLCQFFGSASDGLGGGLGTFAPQVLQNLQHPGGLVDGGKPDASSPSEFLVGLQTSKLDFNRLFMRSSAVNELADALTSVLCFKGYKKRFNGLIGSHLLVKLEGYVVCASNVLVSSVKEGTINSLGEGREHFECGKCAGGKTGKSLANHHNCKHQRKFESCSDLKGQENPEYHIPLIKFCCGPSKASDK